jgi:Tol biopolymer transport system component
MKKIKIMGHKLQNIRLLLIVIITALLVGNLSGQIGYYFGQNKVHYKKFKWAVFRTEHFDVHYYIAEEEAARDAARMAERGYDYLSEVLNHKFKQRIPLILYSSMNDFQQTNTISSQIGDGTRGVTESLKGRVILPITGSYRDFNHVLVHELVHAFQYDIMFNRQSRIRPPKFNPPLWLVEGMAEYLSVGMDNITRMWVRDGLLHDNLISIEKLSTTYDIRVYRLGEAVWNFIGEKYGKKMVGKIFKYAAASGNIEMAFKKNIGLSLKELTQDWHAEMRKQVLPTDSTLKSPNEIAQQISKKRGYYHRMNILPAVSPNGRSIAYVANKNLHDEIYVIHEYLDGTVEEKRVLKGGQSKNFEAVRFFDSAINWNPDGSLITFVAKAGREDAIYIMNPFTRKVEKKLVFKKMNGILSPAFSPRGDQIVFVGITGGISNLYIVDRNGKNLKQLTKDKYTDLQPQWSPDGKSIVFISDRGKGTNTAKLLFDDYDLAIFDLASGEISIITELDGITICPQWSSNSQEVAFISDHQGIPNIYKINLETKEISSVFSIINGVSGITESTPAMSWSADNNILVFSSFINGSWHIYRTELINDEDYRPEQENEDAIILSYTDKVSSSTDGLGEDSTTFDNDSLWLPSFADPNEVYEEYKLENPDSLEKRKYSSKFKLDAVAFGAGFDTFYGAGGDAQFLFGDMLGNHTIYLYTQLQFNSFLHSNFGLTYLNQSGRLNYGVQGYQSNYSYAIGGTFTSIDLIRNTYRGFNGILSYPFSKFSRIEFFGGYTWVDQDFVREIYTPGGIDRSDFDITTYGYAQVGGALVFDNTIYGPLGPFSGTRSRISVETTNGDFNFTNIILDHRRYYNMFHRTVIAWRLMGGTSLGQQKQIFSLGGPYTFRGADFDSFIGTNFFVSNLEYRFPLFFFLPPQFDYLSAAVFYDAAAAWGLDAAPFSKSTFQPFSSDGGPGFEDIRSAVGVGARLNIGYFLLQYDFAWPTDLRGFDKVYTKFSIGTFF